MSNSSLSKSDKRYLNEILDGLTKFNQERHQPKVKEPKSIRITIKINFNK